MDPKNTEIFDDIAGLKFTLETDGFDRFEAACLRDDHSAREFLLGQEGIREALVLKTCQRYELYVSGPQSKTALSDIVTKIGLNPTDGTRLLVGEDVVEHLFRVACGLESGVIGEDEILGQLRGAYNNANDSGALGETLGLVVLKALRVGERARTETSINEGRVSLGTITVERAREELETFESVPDDLDECSVLVIGAGKIGRQVVKAVTNHTDVASLTVANRTLERARKLTAEVGGDAISLDALDCENFATADLVVSATGSDERVVSGGTLRGHDLVAIDLANPRDIAEDADDLPGIRVIRIDDVLSTRNEGIERRKQAVPAVKEIITAERKHLREQIRIEQIDATVGDLYARAHNLRKEELETAQERLAQTDEELSETQRQVLADFSESLINKVLHPKAAAIREAAARGDQETVEACLELFEQASTGGGISEPQYEGEVEDEDRQPVSGEAIKSSKGQ